VLHYLAAAGVGRLGIVDMDRVDESNLQRQVIHGEAALGRDKALSARDGVLRIDARTVVDVHTCEMTGANVDQLLRPYDLAVGCVDDIAARYVLDAACVRQGKAHVYGALRGFEGQAGVFGAPGPCYRCFFREPPEAGWRPDPLEKGVLGSVAGMIGCIQATETIKLLLGAGASLRGRLLLADGLRMRFRELPLRRDPECPVCSCTAAKK
jgi:adenylyltransferase/sulfurtransferase